jgi:trimeric autotransporter adhesin
MFSSHQSGKVHAMFFMTRGNRFPLGVQFPAAGTIALAAAFMLAGPPQAHAVECLLDTNDNDFAEAADTDGGATGTGANSLACGPETDASGDGSVAVGTDTDGNGVGTTATGTSSTAVGGDALASGFGATAVGGDADFAENPGGSGATASGDLSSAFGADAVASGDLATAIGAFAEASGVNSTALGAGAVALLPDEFVLGTAINTYTAPGITNLESRLRQSGPLELVTSDRSGHLATDGGAVFGGMADVRAGVALALAMEAPDLAPTERMAVRAGYGNFEGDSHAFGLSAIGSLGMWGRRWTWDAGFGAGWSDFGGYDSDATWGGRAGVQMAW